MTQYTGMLPVTQDVEQPAGRLIGLDILRGIAVLLVLGHHLPVHGSDDQPGLMGAFLAAWRRGGWVGVDLFFVLSGFLVSGLLFAEYRKKGTLSVGRFYVRRGWKIYPPFFFLIAVTVLVQLSVHHSVDLGALMAECFFIQNYASGLWNHTWSLAVEEHFYIGLPLLLVGICMLNRGARDPFAWMLPMTVAVGAVTALAMRLDQYSSVPWFNHHTHLAPTHLRIDSLLFGVLIAYAYHFHRDQFVRFLRPVRMVLILAGISLLAAPFVYSREGNAFVYTIGPTLYSLGSGALVVGVLLTPMPRRGLWMLSRIGVYSYSIYLWHMPVMRWGPKLAFDTTWGMPALAVLSIGGSVVVGIVMAKAIEAPALRLRDRLFPSASSSSAAASAPADSTIGCPEIASASAGLSRS